jgi:membrane protease subunit (stomatin/prohibitin family)
MGIIRAAVNAVHGSLADQWLETVEPYEMGEHTVFTEGILVRKGQNKKGSQTISNGSVIHVYDNQFMMLVDGGKIIDYTAEPGYFTVDQSSSPSMFSGSLDAAVKDTFERLKFGGQTPHEQRVFYINLQEIKGIRSTISTSSTMPSCSFGHTVPIPSASSIRSASTQRLCRETHPA